MHFNNRIIDLTCEGLEKEIDESSEFKRCIKGATRKAESQSALKHTSDTGTRIKWVRSNY